MTLFTSTIHVRVLLRIWDLFFYEGSVILFRVALAMIRMHEPNLKELQNSADIFNSLSDLPRQVMIEHHSRDFEERESVVDKTLFVLMKKLCFSCFKQNVLYLPLTKHFYIQ